jgi:hypothetical protein
MNKRQLNSLAISLQSFLGSLTSPFIAVSTLLPIPGIPILFQHLKRLEKILFFTSLMHIVQKRDS